MYFFFNLTIKSPERPHWGHSTFFIGSPVHVLRIDFENSTVYVYNRTLSESVPKILKPVAFLLVYQIIPTFFKPVTKIKKNSWYKGTWGPSANKMVYAKCTFLLGEFCIPSFRAIPHVIDKQSGACWRYLLLQGLYVPSVKTM